MREPVGEENELLLLEATVSFLIAKSVKRLSRVQSCIKSNLSKVVKRKCKG